MRAHDRRKGCILTGKWRSCLLQAEQGELIDEEEGIEGLFHARVLQPRFVLRESLFPIIDHQL